MLETGIQTRSAAALSGVDLYAMFVASTDATERTRETYRRNLRAWRRYIESRGITETEATRQTVLDFRTELLEQGKTAATVNSYLSAVRRFYSFLEALRICPNVAAAVKGVRRNKRSPKDALTRDQAAALLSRPAESLEELRNAAIIELMLRRGLRAVEVTRADIGDIRQVAGQAVLWVQGKGYADKGDFVLLNEPCLKSINAYLERRGCSDLRAPLFAGVGNRNKGGRLTTRAVSGICKSAMRDAGISSPRLTAHSLRHTAVTFALIGGATVQEAQAMARHSSIETTLVYAHNLDRLAGGAEHSIDRYLADARIQTEYKANTH